MSDYGNDDENQIGSFSKSYKKDPTIELYVKLRRKSPAIEIEVAVIGGIEQLAYMQPEIERYGLNSMLVAGVMDADPEAVSELSLQLLEKMIEAKTLLKNGETHIGRRGLAIPDRLIDWLIKCMLDAMSWSDDLYIPRDLIVLLRERLGGSNPQYEQATEANEMRQRAAVVGGQIMARGETPSFRQLGRILGVAASTVKRWFPEGDFLQQAEQMSHHFDEEGHPINRR